MQVCQDSREVACTFNCRAGCCLDADTDFGRDNMSQAGLAKTGGAIKENMVERFTPAFGGSNGDF
jgi:hypothetical protein